jgi:hypothetical protein
MPNSKPLAALFALLTASLLSACDPAAAVLQGFRRPTALCNDVGDASCPPPIVNPDDLAPN